jgi:molybdopterin molybdotransferase
MPAEGLLSLEAALARLLDGVGPLAVETVPLVAAAGRFLAGALVARRTQPPADVSAMDGYALRFADLPGPFTVVGEAVAGQPLPRRVETGEAVRIFTGAHLPQGADTVAVQEDAERDGPRLRFPGGRPAHAAAHVRARGLDFAAGDAIGEAGARVTPALIGLAAAAGHAALPVHRAPLIALLATGDELVPPGTVPGPGQIVSANGAMLAALFAAAGAVVTDLGIARDSPTALAAAIGRAQGHDLIVTIGGASVGDHDLVKPALEAAGAELAFWRVAIRPGKPLFAGRLGAMRVLGLPGNPASAFVCAHLFAVPLIRRLLGDPATPADPIPARTTTDLRANGPRRDFLRARLRTGPAGAEVTVADRQDSSLVSVLAASNALVVRPEQAGPLSAGSTVPVLTFSEGGAGP